LRSGDKPASLGTYCTRIVTMPEAANPFAQLTGAPPPPPPAPAAVPAAKPLAQSNPMEGDAQRRFRLEVQEPLQRSDPFRDPNVLITKDAAGNVTAEARAADPAAAPQPGEPPRAGEPQLRLERTGDGRFVLAEGMEPMTDQQLRDLVSFKAAEDSRKLSTPKPGEYQLKFNDDFILPQGTDWRWDEGNPLLAQVREFASASGMTQQTFSKLLGLHAASRIGEDMAFAEARAAEVRALGDSANQRVDAVKTWLKAMAPDHFAGLARVLEMAPSAATVRGLEVLMQRHVSQGAAGYKGNNREAPEHPAKLPESVVEKMSYPERLAYASKFPQPNR
jgi:hypothetical protein